VQILAQKKYKFILSCAKNRPSWLWQYLQSGLKLYGYKAASSSNMDAISYYARKQKSTKKIVNFLTNVKNMTAPSSRKIWNKSEKQMKEVFYLKIISEYNKNHQFVDRLKQRIKYIGNPFRARRAWRAEFNSMIYILLNNCYVWFTSVTGRNLNFREFILKTINQIRTPKISQSSHNQLNLNMPQNSNTITYHKLKSSFSKSKCIVCKKRTRRMCSICNPTIVALHEGYCNLVFHNPGIVINM